MATTYTDNGGGAPNGSDKIFTFTFPVLQNEDVKVALNGVTQATTKYTVDTSTNPTQIEFNNTNIDSSVQETTGAPKSGVIVRVFRETTVGKVNGDDDPKAVFAAGSSIRASDLNANTEQALYAIHELQNQPIKTGDVEDGAITSSKILDGTIVESDLSNSAVTQNKLANNSVGTPELINGSVNSDKILDGTIVNADVNASAAIAGTKIDADFGSQDVITTGNLGIGGAAAITGNISVSGTVDGRDVAADGTKLDTIQTNAKDDQTAAEIKTLLQSDKLTASEIATGALDGRYYTEAESDARYFNVSSGDTIKDGDTFPDNDTTIATTAAINDRIIDLVEEVGGFVAIPNEDSFPNANPDINNGAGTIISVKAASTTLTPNGSNQVILSSANLANNADVLISGVTSAIPQGFGFLVETTTTTHEYTFHRLSPKATEVTTVAGSIGNINTVGNAISNVNAVAGNASNINTVAGINANVTTVAGISSNVTSVANNESNINAVQGNATNINAVAGNNSNITAVAGNASNINSAVSNASNINSAVSNASNITTVAGSISNVNTTAGSISNVNTVASNINNVNNFNDKYQIASNNPTTDGGGNALAAGDLYFNTSANELKVYNGSSWQGGVTAAGSFAATTGNTFTGDNRYNDNVKALFGTGSDLEIFHNGINSIIRDVGQGNVELHGDNVAIRNGIGSEVLAGFIPNGAVELFYNNSKKFATTSSGVNVTGQIVATTNMLISGNNGGLFFGSSFVYGTNAAIGIASNDNYHVTGSEAGDLVIASKAGEHIVFGANTIGLTPTKRLRITRSGNIEIPTDSSSEFIGRLQIGASQDLQIFHDGSHSVIDNLTGGLFIKGGTSNGITLQNRTGNESMAKFIPDGAAELYYDNNKKFETTSGGAQVTGNLLITNNLNVGNDLVMGDTDEIQMGDNQDFRIYHTSGTNYIEAWNNSNFKIAKWNGSAYEDMITAASDAAVELYYNGSKKLETASGGVTVTGDFLPDVTDGRNLGSSSKKWAALHLKYNLYMSDNGIARFGDNSDLEIYHDGSNTRIANSTGDLKLQGGGDDILLQPVDTEIALKAVPNGAVELYYDNSKKLETASGGVTVTGTVTATSFSGDGSNLTGVSSVGGATGVDFNDGVKARFGNSQDLQIYHDASDSYLKNSQGDLLIQNTGDDIYIDAVDDIFIRTSTNEDAVKCLGDGAVELYYDGSKKLHTISPGVQVTGNIYVNDGNTFTAGGNNDATFFHDGTDTYIQNTTGKLRIGNTHSGIIKFFTNNGTRWNVGSSGHFYPDQNNTYDIGSTSYRVRNIYTNDLHLSNEGHSNDVDGSWGDWTIQEGESDLFLKNNRSGKKYKFNLTEVS